MHDLAETFQFIAVSGLNSMPAVNVFAVTGSKSRLPPELISTLAGSLPRAGSLMRVIVSMSGRYSSYKDGGRKLCPREARTVTYGCGLYSKPYCERMPLPMFSGFTYFLMGPAHWVFGITAGRRRKTIENRLAPVVGV